jgi:hypothetical protein
MSTGNSPGEELPEDLKTIETALRQLTPGASQIDRDRLMYLAGQASVMNSGIGSSIISETRFAANNRRNLWPMATAALALISITLGGLLLHAKRSEELVVRVERLPVESGNSSDIVSSGPTDSFTFGVSTVGNNANYLQLRNLLLVRGVDALLPSPVPGNTVSPTSTPPILPTLRHEMFDNQS